MADTQQGAKPVQTPAPQVPKVNAEREAERRLFAKDIACAILTRGSRTPQGLANEAVKMADEILAALER